MLESILDILQAIFSDYWAIIAFAFLIWVLILQSKIKSVRVALHSQQTISDQRLFLLDSCEEVHSEFEEQILKEVEDAENTIIAQQEQITALSGTIDALRRIIDSQRYSTSPDCIEPQVEVEVPEVEVEVEVEEAEIENLKSCLSESQGQIEKLQSRVREEHRIAIEHSVTISSLEKLIERINRKNRILDNQLADLMNAVNNPEVHNAKELKKIISDLLEYKENHEENLKKLLSSNLTSIPWLSGMMADYLTYDLEIEAKKLDWGSNVERQKKVASIREIRADAKARIEQAKSAVYQLEYLKNLFPAIDDILETDYKDLDFEKTSPEQMLSDYDPVRGYLTKEEWEKLSSVEKDQLALDRYVQSRSKNKWQIGRDYELSVAYEYRKKGYTVDTFGSYMKLDDLGRDLIAKSEEFTLIIQCKYWSKEKTIHEKHIYQLYGTLISYCIEHNLPIDAVHGVFVTSTNLSPTARKAAKLLGIQTVENHPMVEFPRIKCNVNRDEYGCTTKIFHLPMDSQYDNTKIEKNGECYAFTVEEAVSKGFRRAYRWHGQ